jgi:hypothetical protein
MGLSAADIASMTTAVEETMDSSGIVPEGSTLSKQVEVHGNAVLATMQRALRPRLGTLPSPLGDDLLELCTKLTKAAMMFAAFGNLSDDEKAWPDELQRQGDNELAALASGIDTVDVSVAATTQATAAASNTRIFTASGFDALL